MNGLADRTALISERLNEMLLVTLAIPTSTMPVDDWLALDLSPGEGFGFKWPLPFEDTALVAFCPEIINAQTAWMDEEQWDSYMEIIEYMICLHLERMHLPIEERVRIVESLVWETKPEAMEFLSFIQMTILDMTQEPE